MLRRILRYFATEIYALLLKWNARRSSTLENLVAVAFDSHIYYLRITPLQLRDELLKLVRILDRERPRRIVEIGTARGGTLFLLCQTAASNATVVSIDLPGGSFGGGYPVWKQRLYHSFVSPDQTLHLLRANSHDPATEQQARELLGGSADCLLIDGDHRYEGVRTDFEMYSKMVRPGGLIILHDVRPGDAERGGEVPKFWSELKQHYDCWEILSDRVKKNFGLGLIRW